MIFDIGIFYITTSVVSEVYALAGKQKDLRPAITTSYLPWEGYNDNIVTRVAVYSGPSDMS